MLGFCSGWVEYLCLCAAQPDTARGVDGLYTVCGVELAMITPKNSSVVPS